MLTEASTPAGLPERGVTNYGDAALQSAQAHAATLLEDLGYNISACVEPNVLVQLRGWLRNRQQASVYSSCASEPDSSPPRGRASTASSAAEQPSGSVRYYEIMSDYFSCLGVADFSKWEPLWARLWGHVRVVRLVLPSCTLHVPGFFPASLAFHECNSII